MERDPQLRHRGFFREADHAVVGRYRAPRPTFTLSGSDCEIGPAPLLGEHKEYVLRDICGPSDDDVARLLAAGAVE